MKGKVAIVTGGAQGVGRATASELVRRGAKVIVADVDDALGQNTAAEIGPNAYFRRLDVSNEESWIDAVAFAQRELGGYDILVNNAANPSRLTPIDEATYEEWLEVFKVNSAGVFLGCKHAIHAMKETGGAIVNVSSQSAVIGLRSVPLYSSSKGSVNALTRAIAAHCRLGGLPIRCNTVMPGGIYTKMSKDAVLKLAGIDLEDGSPEAAQVIKAMVGPETIAGMIVFLASDDASHVNGTEVLVDGGEALTYSM